MPLPDHLLDQLRSARADGVDPRDLLAEVARLGGFTTTSEGVSIDLDRARRCGHPEVIFAQGKTNEALLSAVARQCAADQPVLATRVSEEQARAVLAEHSAAIWNSVARTVRLEPEAGSQRLEVRGQRSEVGPAALPTSDLRPLTSDIRPPTSGRVVVITAGTSDRPVAEEALETLAWMQVGRDLIVDVGVAGPWRILEQLPRLHGADAVIVVAGMEGALPSVVGGWVPCPVIAVPTSIGYGSSFGGLTALLGMLNSCAANVTVVNIDAGFKAGYVAGLIARGNRGQKSEVGDRQPDSDLRHPTADR
jgi:NCAIR mutase (PurE)-related protein